MQKCFKFIIRLIDEAGLRYYGKGYLVAQPEKVEGFISYDYFALEYFENDVWHIILTTDFEKVLVDELVSIEPEFPGEHEIQLEGEIKEIRMDVLNQIKNREECNVIIKNLDEIRKKSPIN